MKRFLFADLWTYEECAKRGLELVNCCEQIAESIKTFVESNECTKDEEQTEKYLKNISLINGNGNKYAPMFLDRNTYNNLNEIINSLKKYRVSKINKIRFARKYLN